MTILNNILAVSWHEFRVMCTRYSILLVLSGGIFVYGLLYNYMYAPNVVRDAPVAVVDMSRSKLTAQDAEQQTIEFLKKWVNPKTSPMCGNSICQDRRF
jgi:hypothetical protein